MLPGSLNPPLADYLINSDLEPIELRDAPTKTLHDLIVRPKGGQ